MYFGEKWLYITEKSVPNIVPNSYIVSDEGRVFSLFRNQYLTPTLTWNGYLRVCLRLINNISRYYLIHRIMMIEFCYIDNYKELQVNHFNGDKEYNKIWNTEWVTPGQNIQHAFDTGLKSQYHGEDCSWATITNDQARQIAQMLLQGMRHKDIANIIGCNESVVSNISQGSNWKEIYDEYNLESRKKKFILNLSDNELHKLCEYWQDHKNCIYRYKTDLFKESLKNVFGIDFDHGMSATLTRLYNRQTRTDITNQYDF